jgi:hypothetical protein
MQKKYREVYCPVCMKKYMTYVYSDYYTVIIKYNGVKKEGWGDTCPKCKTHLFVEDHVLEGVKMDDFPESAVRETFII